MTVESKAMKSNLKKAELNAAIKNKSLWLDAWYRLKKDKIAVVSLTIVIIYAVVAVLSSVGIIASNWAAEVGPSYGEPTWDNWLGTDIFGRSVLSKVIHGSQVAMSVGLFLRLFQFQLELGLVRLLDILVVGLMISSFGFIPRSHLFHTSCSL